MPRYLLFIVTGLVFAATSHAGDKQQWEFGIGPGWARIPHYRGSDQAESYTIPFPYIRYYGKRLRIDREGGRFYFIEKESVKLDVSLAFAPPVDSDDNRARAGMPGLDAIFEIGPRLEFDLYQSSNRDVRLRAALPLRAAIASDFKDTQAIGYVFSPYLQLRYYGGAESSISIGPIWASEDYHDYFYEVVPSYATANRPEYDAQSGYSGSRITLTSSYRWKDYWLGLFARYDDLNDAVFADSPVIRQSDSLMLGIGFAWVIRSTVSR